MAKSSTRSSERASRRSKILRAEELSRKREAGEMPSVGGQHQSIRRRLDSSAPQLLRQQARDGRRGIVRIEAFEIVKQIAGNASITGFSSELHEADQIGARKRTEFRR